MTSVKVRKLWTAFVGALFALLASLGLTSAATAAQQPGTTGPEQPRRAAGATGGAAAGTGTGTEAGPEQRADTRTEEAARPTGARQTERDREAERARERAVRALLPTLIPAQGTHRYPGARDRSLPPTIKQRISAEAHGASPSVRKVPDLDFSAPEQEARAEAVVDRALTVQSPAGGAPVQEDSGGRESARGGMDGGGAPNGGTATAAASAGAGVRRAHSASGATAPGTAGPDAGSVQGPDVSAASGAAVPRSRSGDLTTA
jgi:hypothetical protein